MSRWLVETTGSGISKGIKGLIEHNGAPIKEKCWHCNRITRQELTIHNGQRHLLCTECGNIIVEQI